MKDLFRKLVSDSELDKSSSSTSLLKDVITLFSRLRRSKVSKYKRVLPFPEHFTDRWEKAALCGFGKRTSIYDSALVIGEVSVGEDTWIGPNVILDGSGGLKVGNNCSLSANVQIYSHDTVQWAITGGDADYEYEPTEIGNNVYVGPNSVIQKGVTIGNGVVIGANSLVNRDIPDGARAWGTPARIQRAE